jgi:hypothetical protein
MRIGLDFDNTIVCYDRLFHRVARELGLIPSSTPVNKTAVRDTLRAMNCESDWTRMQGQVYGPRIAEAEPFPGVKAFLKQCVDSGIEVVIVSHKTRHPYLGEKHDLHAAAHEFLRQHGFYHTSTTGLAPDRVFLELTKDAKLARIGSAGCDWFIDDLPELLLEEQFPTAVERILFDPAGQYPDHRSYRRAHSWADITSFFSLVMDGRAWTSAQAA